MIKEQVIKDIKDKGGKHSAIEKALIILKLFNQTNRELGTLEISKTLGYNKATVSRTLQLLVRHNFLEQDPQTRKFRLGSAILTLGMVMNRSLKADLVHIAKPYMNELRDRFQESVVLEVLSTKHVVIANISEGPKRIRLAGEIGDIMPSHVAAGAKAILAFSSREIRESLLSREFKRFTSNTIMDTEILLKQFEEIRKSGVSYDIAEHDIDVNAIGAPILNIEERPIAAVVIAGFPKNIDTNPDSEMVACVKATALEISKQLYYSHAETSEL